MKNCSMKYVCLSIFFCLPPFFCAQSSNACENDTTDQEIHPMYVGLNFGVNFSETIRKDGVYAFETDYIHRFSYGLSFQYRLSPSWFLSSGVQYESKGFRFGPDMINYTSYNFISMPLMINIQSKGNVSVYAGLGGYAAYLLDIITVSLTNYSNFPLQIQGKFFHRNTDRFEAIDLGLAAQTGVRVPLNKCTMLDFQIAYSHGFVSASKHAEFLQRSLLANLSFKYRF